MPFPIRQRYHHGPGRASPKVTRPVPIKPQVPPGKLTKMTPRERKFCKCYIACKFNGTEAAIKAGYSRNGAKVTASRLLTKPNVQAELQRLMAPIDEAYIMSGQQVLEELSKLGRANMADYTKVDAKGDAYIDLRNVPREKWAAIQEITSEVYIEARGDEDEPPINVKRTKFKLADKRGSLELLGRHHKLFTDKAELDIPNGINLTVQDARATVLSKLGLRTKDVAVAGKKKGE
jgi:phage terminase small subunit